MSKNTHRLPQILICDDDSIFHLAVKHTLKGLYECRSANNGDEAVTIIKNHPIDAVLLDIQMRTADEGLKTIPKIKEVDPDVAIIISSGLSDFNTVKQAIQLGASDYIPKDFDPTELTLAIGRVLEKRILVQLNKQRSFEAQSSQNRHPFIGNAPSILELRKAIEKVRLSSAAVIISGETGTGKEVVARQLRKVFSDGTLAPFVSIDSATIQNSMAESILFGHEKGAFTGAEKSTKGIFEEANGGVVYFDEIANMPLDIQAKLLRVLQEKEISRVGSSKVIPLEFRVICATNKDLEELVKAGLFKEDLHQRLNVLPIQLPPLRDRKEDIRDLVRHFSQKETSRPLNFTADAIGILEDYSWPGNIRELSNVVAYVIAMTDGNEVDTADLPPKLRAKASSATGKPQASNDSFYDQVAGFEREILKAKYAQYEGNISKLALALGMDRSHLYTKLREYGLHGSTKT